MPDGDKVFDLLMEVKDRQGDMAGDIKAIKEHLSDMNGSIKNQRELCRSTRNDVYNKINKANIKIAMASGGLGGIMAILVILSYLNFL